jgi:O-antigen ligase
LPVQALSFIVHFGREEATMTNAVRGDPGISWFSLILSARHDPVARILNADLLAVLIAILLPWSTSGVAIAAVLWIIALVPTLEVRALLRSLARPISALPIALFALALAGTLWSDASWGVRLYAVSPTAKFLMLPLLFYHFERSPRGEWVFVAFLASCVLLMPASWLVAFDPHLSLNPDLSSNPEAQVRGIFVKNYIDQSQEFALCAVALAYPILVFWRTKRAWLAALFAAIALGFIVNLLFVVVSRTALVTIPVMLAVFAVVHLRWRTAVILFCAALALAAMAWAASPHLQRTTNTFLSDYQSYKKNDEANSIGLRLEFWRKSLRFVGDAPMVGHGTGSTRGLFERAATGPEALADGQVIDNPHNQTLNVAVQWGMVGIIVLYAMWWWHFRLFRGDDLASWIGLLVVAQNVLSSLFNSHLFDFHEGWMYVLGVGVAGGMTLQARRSNIEEITDERRGLSGETV